MRISGKKTISGWARVSRTLQRLEMQHNAETGLFRKPLIISTDRQFLGVIKNKMAVRIRLTRMGAKKKPFYRVVAADSEAPRDGKFIEILGHYDPMKDPAVIKVDKDRVNAWLDKGARVSESVKSLLKKQDMPDSQSL